MGKRSGSCKRENNIRRKIRKLEERLRGSRRRIISSSSDEETNDGNVVGDIPDAETGRVSPIINEIHTEHLELLDVLSPLPETPPGQSFQSDPIPGPSSAEDIVTESSASVENNSGEPLDEDILQILGTLLLPISL
ncbi:unnamed protein product, partial [Iphiclides podalirius]